jgi:Flp pilus assembly protein TadG
MALELFAFSRRSKGTTPPRGVHARLASAPLGGPGGVVQLLGDKSGASATIIGLTAMVLLGFTALGTEASYWYFTHRNLQNAADSAAMGAVAALQNIQGSPDAAHKTSAIAEAKATAARYGFTDAQGGVAVAVNIPPTAGAYTSQANAVEVVITEPQALFLTAAIKYGGTPLLAANPTQKVRAVAHPGTNGNGCDVTLDKNTVSNLTTNGNTVLNLTGCDLYVNSNATNALDQVGQATITARAAFVTGGITSTAQASLTTTVGTFTGTAPINDPYANLPAPYTSPGSTCTNANPATSSHVNITTSGSVTKYSPDGTGMAIFCGGWSPPAGTVSLDPGLYVVDGGTFGCNACTISGSNVTIFLTGSGTNYATLAFAGTGSAQLNINAPTYAYVTANPSTKALMGIAIYADRNAPTTSNSSFSGNASATINGVIYMPTHNVTFNGNGAAGSPTCSQIITFTQVFHGNSTFQNNCADYSNPATGQGVVGIGAIPAQLVE